MGVDHLPAYAGEVEALEALVAAAGPGDVIGLMTHQDRDAVYAWLGGRGFVADTPSTLRDKVRLARP